MLIDKEYSKKYREKLGFTNQQVAKYFFSGKDYVPTVDFDYIHFLNDRLKCIIEKLNKISHSSVKNNDIQSCKKKYIDEVFEEIKKNKIIQKLNNQGRRPEKVYFSWMRGYVILNYFLTALSIIFEVEVDDINLIGDDNLVNVNTFKRTPKADLEISFKNGDKVRIEIQSGFQGTNDVKQHKVLEAKKIYKENQMSSLVIHFDLYNGKVAFIKLDNIEGEKLINSPQMEGQPVFNIDQNCFVWKLTDKPPRFRDLKFN